MFRKMDKVNIFRWNIPLTLIVLWAHTWTIYVTEAEYCCMVDLQGDAYLSAKNLHQLLFYGT